MDTGLIFPDYFMFVTSCGGTQEDKHAHDWMCAYKRVATDGRKIHRLVKVRRDVDSLRTRRC